MEKNICFIAMPISKTIGDRTAEYWERKFLYFKDVVERIVSLEAKRSRALRIDILKEIITQLVTAKIVVVDITDHNPNVFWELGVRQSFKNGTITIAQAGTPLPFDINTKGLIYYYPEGDPKNIEFEESLLEALRDCEENPEVFDSHVLETITGRGSLFEIINKEQTLRKLDALVAELEFDLQTIEIMIDYARDNQKDLENLGRKIPTERFRVSALELLTTTRYLKEDESFYEEAEHCFALINRANGQAERWHLNLEAAKAVESWLINTTREPLDYCKGFKETVGSIRERLKNKVPH